MTGYETYLGPMISFLTVAGGVTATIVALRTTVKDLKEDVEDMKAEIRKLTEVMVSVARQDERMVAMDQRMLAQGQRIDEMRSAVSRTEGTRFDVLCEQLNRLIAAHSTA